MVSILQLADSRLGARPAGLEARSADLWAGLSRAIDAAIDLRCDAIVHSGGLIEHDTPATDMPERLARAFQPALENGVRVIACLPAGGAPAPAVPGIEWIEIGANTAVGGVLVRNDGAAAFETVPTPVAAPALSCVWGRIDGIAGIVRGAPDLPVDAVASLADQVAWVGAGGVGRYARIAPRAAYAPATAQANSWEAGDAGGGVLIEFDDVSTSRAPRVTQVVWPDRPRASVVIDAGRMDDRHAAAAVTARLAALQELAPSVGPLSLAATVLPAELRGRAPRGPVSAETRSWYEHARMGWVPEGAEPWDRPVVSITIRGTHATLTDLRLANAELDELLAGGTQLVCSIRIGSGGWTHVLPERELGPAHH